jgi:hypothetical protein
MTIKRITTPYGEVSHISGFWGDVYVSMIAHNHMLAIEKARIYIEKVISDFKNK